VSVAAEVPEGVETEVLGYGRAINQALAEEMRRDPRVWMMGQDIGKMGGVFGVTKGLAARFGTQGNLAPRFSYPTILLDQQLMAKNFLNRAEVEAAAQRFVLEFPGVAAAFTRSQLETGNLPDNPLRMQVLRAWNRDLSGDVYVVQDPFTLFGGNLVTHGSPYSYDTSVPLMLLGRQWIKPGRYAQAVAVADLAPTLSFLLEIRPPSGSEGRVLEEILR